MGLGGRGKVRTLSIIVPSTVDRVDLKKVVVRARKMHSTPRASSPSFFPSLSPHFHPRMRPRVWTMDTEYRRGECRGGPLEKGAGSTVFDIREELLEERWPPVVVASGREKRAPGPDLSSVPMRGSARYRSAETHSPIVPSGVMSRVSRL